LALSITKTNIMSNTKNQHPVKRIAIVAYDDNQKHLIEWSFFNRQVLQQHKLTALGANARLLQGTLGTQVAALPAPAVSGYQELASLITQEEIDVIFFLGDASELNSSGTGIRELLHLAIEHNILIAGNTATAGIILGTLHVDNSPLQNNYEHFHQKKDNRLYGINNQLLIPIQAVG